MILILITRLFFNGMIEWFIFRYYVHNFPLYFLASGKVQFKERKSKIHSVPCKNAKLLLLVGAWSIVLSSDFVPHSVTWWASSVLRVWGLLWIMIRCQMVFVRLAFLFLWVWRRPPCTTSSPCHNRLTDMEISQNNSKYFRWCAALFLHALPFCLPTCAISWISASWVTSF